MLHLYRGKQSHEDGLQGQYVKRILWKPELYHIAMILTLDDPFARLKCPVVIGKKCQLMPLSNYLKPMIIGRGMKWQQVRVLVNSKSF